MNNKSLIKYIDALKLFGETRAIILGDLDLNFIYVTNYYQQMMGNPDVIGKKLRDTDHVGKEYADELRKISLKVLATGDDATFFAVYKFPDSNQKRCYIYHMSPIIELETGKTIGLITELKLFNCKYLGHLNNFVQKLVAGNSSKSDTLSKSGSVYQLDDREAEVLFLLMVGRSYKEIAYIIGSVYNKSITPSAVNAVIREKLFRTFGVNSVGDLISKAAHHNVIEEIPNSLLVNLEGAYELNYCGD